jgi:hypothetical protein
VKLHIEEAEHCETLGILCECGKKFKGNTSGGYYYHRLALHGHKPQPKIGLAASTATGDPHLPNSGLAATTATATGDPHLPSSGLAANTATGDPHPPNIVLAATTATGEPHLPNIVLAATPASESHAAFEQVEEVVLQNFDHQYNLKDVACKSSSLFCFFNHMLKFFSFKCAFS